MSKGYREYKRIHQRIQQRIKVTDIASSIKKLLIYIPVVNIVYVFDKKSDMSEVCSS